jgi:hypothetical protein
MSSADSTEVQVQVQGSFRLATFSLLPLSLPPWILCCVCVRACARAILCRVILLCLFVPSLIWKSLMAFDQFSSICCVRLSCFRVTLHKVLHASFHRVNPIFVFCFCVFSWLVLFIYHSLFNPSFKFSVGVQVFLCLITQSSLTTAFSSLTSSPSWSDHRSSVVLLILLSALQNASGAASWFE